MSDEAETLQTLFYAKRRALYPSTVEADVFDTALRALESQNQALQREVENKAAILNAIEALLDVDDEHTGWDRIVALQERIEELETVGRDLLREGFGNTRGSLSAQKRFVQLLSPTQETDSE